MNRTPVRRRVLFAAGLVLLGVYALLSVLQSRSAAERLAAARQDLAEIDEKLAQIARLREAPKVAALQLESPAEISNRVAEARRAAGLAQSVLLREEPLDPQRIGRTDFELRATSIDLSAATLSQILTFCDHLRDEGTGSLVRDIRLTIPEDESTGSAAEGWQAGLTLTQMIFSPKSR